MAKLLLVYMSADGLMEFAWVKKQMKQGLGFIRWRNQQFYLDPRKIFRVRWPMWLIWPFLKINRGILAIRFNEGRPGAVPTGANYIQALLPGSELPEDEPPKQATSYAIDQYIRNDRPRKIFAPAKLDPVIIFLGLCLLVSVAGNVMLGLGLLG